MTSRYRFALAGPPRFDDGDWLTVEGGGLDYPIALRLARVPPSRLAVTNLVVMGNSSHEVTAKSLRTVRLGAILEELGEYLRSPDPAWLADGVSLEWFDWSAVRELAGTAPVTDAEPRKRGVPPTDAELRRFARTYLEELTRRPRRAMTSAATICNLSRTTANRWAAICRERGYLPSRVEEDR